MLQQNKAILSGTVTFDAYGVETRTPEQIQAWSNFVISLGISRDLKYLMSEFSAQKRCDYAVILMLTFASRIVAVCAMVIYEYCTHCHASRS